MGTEYQEEVGRLQKELLDLASELRSDEDVSADRIEQIETEIAAKAARLDSIKKEKKADETEARIAELDSQMKAFQRERAQSKAAAILQNGGNVEPLREVGPYNQVNWLSALKAQYKGDQDAANFVKGVLGTSTATGQAIIPANFVTELVTQLALNNVYRGLFAVNPGVVGAGVNIPYEITAVTAALLQGAYGSNKDIRDWSFNSATATLYTIAQIADISNQLLRQSNGNAERAARRRLAGSIGMLEAQFITNGSGSSQPLGFFQAFLAFGDPAGFKTTLSSEPRLATIARGIAALESRGSRRDNLIFVSNPTDYWEMAAEGLGTSYAGGWAVAPATGASANEPTQRAWGVELYADPNWPAAQAGTGLLIDRSEVDIFTGQEYRIDVSSEAGSRFDQNITGFRAEEEFAFNAEPYVRTGRVQKIIGI